MYSPYVPEHQGGGERHFFSVAAALSGFAEVSVLIPTLISSSKGDEIRKSYQRKFQLNLGKVKFIRTAIGTPRSAVQKILETARYDVLYYLTDGSLFFSLAKKNLLHIQFPFTFPITRLVDRVKLANWGVKNTNSAFTRTVVQKAWQIKIPYVHYPYVDAEEFVPLSKEKIILSVGRFFTGEQSQTHCKRQDVLVEAFRKLVDDGYAKGWRLVLIGSVDPGEDNAAYAKKVAALAKGYAIKIIHDAGYELLQQYYGHAALYWHAAGFEVDENKEPTKVEHFGISTLEGMASGAVPVVVGKGGQKEIVEHGTNGFLWYEVKELLSYSRILMENKGMREKLSQAARQRSLVFNKDRFIQTLQEMVR